MGDVLGVEREITVRVVDTKENGGAPRFDSQRIKVRAGETIVLTLRNQSDQPMNWVLVQPGQEKEVMIRGFDTSEETDAGVSYSPSVLAATGMVPPGETGTISFIAPDEPGSYPFIATLTEELKPGTQGELVVDPIA